MEHYVLLALLAVGPIEQQPHHGREVTWSAEFNSKEKCEVAGYELMKKYNTKPGEPYVISVDFICM
jgi:hypothetical protein